MIQFLSPRANVTRVLSAAALLTAALLSGCGAGMTGTTSSLAVQGSVQGGLQPVSGASIQVYAASTKGAGTAATKLLSSTVSTDTNGAFTLPTNFKCSNSNDQIYAVATGGNPGGGLNSSLAMMTFLGVCSKLTPSTPIYINEVTTIASVYALSKFMNPTTFDVAANSTDASAVADAFTAASTLANLTTGAAVSTNSVYKKLNSLADSLATCVNSNSNSSPCKTLFTAATPASTKVAPTNTLAATLNIALNPTSNVEPIYNLASVLPFQPTLSSAPADWKLFGVTEAVPPPVTPVVTDPTLTWATPAAITYGTALSASQLNATASVAGTFTYSPAPGAVPSAGTSTLSVTFTPADTTHYSTKSGTVNLVVNKAAPAITWSNPAAITSGTALSVAQLNAASNVSGNFSYTPAAGTVLPEGASTLSATFTPLDSTNYTSANKSVSINVAQGGKKIPVVSWGTPSAIAYGTALSATQLNATASVPGTFAYSPAIGAVPAAGTNTLSVTFTPTDTNTYSSATSTVSLVVNKAATQITWAAPAPITYGTKLSASQLNATASVPGTFTYSPAVGATPSAGANTLTATFTPNDTTNFSNSTATVSLQVDKASPEITWANPAAITYGAALSATQLNATSAVAGSFAYTPASGTVLSSGSQALSTTFTPTDTSNYVAVTKSVTLQVNGGSSTITWANPAAITYGTALSATQLNATSSVAGSFTYSPAIGTVLAAGTQSLTATFTPNDTINYKTQTSTVSLTVNKATPTLTWTPPTSIAYGTVLGSTQLNATASVPGSFVYTPPSGSTLSSGTSSLSVLFTPTDSANYSTATKTVSINVSSGPVSITWPNPAAITYGAALSATQLNATSSVPGTFTYSPAIGTVLTAGTQTLRATFTPNDTTNYSTQTVSATLVVNKATPTITWSTPSAIMSGTALSATQLNATASVAGSFAYSPAAGTVLPAGTTSLTATFTPTDTVNYANQTASVSQVVNSLPTQTAPVITWGTPAAINYGTALSAAQLNATANVAGTFTYNPVIGTVLASGTRTLGVTFTPADSAYTSASATVTVVVNKANPTITWANPAAIGYGSALTSTQLNARSSVAGTFTYSPSLGAVLGTGTQRLSVTFAPTDNSYNSANASVSLVVNKADPVISWATPAAISSGTALSATQLNATANVPGTFVYSPAAGTVPSSGTQTLSATFTPSDSTNYATKIATVSLVVNGSTTPKITWATPAAITYGNALSSAQLNATANVPGSFVYSPAAGTVPGAGTQTLNVTFTPTDTTQAAQKASVSLVVNKATPTITWGTPAGITLGTALSGTQLNATANVPGSFTYTPALGVILSSGNITLTANFAPTDTANYNTATASVTLSVSGSGSGSATNIAIGSTVAWNNVKRLGMNIAGQSYYDSGQMLKNLIFRNPGFEGEIWQSIFKCIIVTATSCTDNNQWSQWPADFAKGGTFEFIYGNAKGMTGTVTSSAPASGSQGVTINFAATAKAPQAGDYVIVRIPKPGNPQSGWWATPTNGATLDAEYTDLSPTTPGKQALKVTAAGSGQGATISSYFDTYGSRSFVQMKGQYRLTFKAKLTGGASQLGVTVSRVMSTGTAMYLDQTVSLGSTWQDYSYTLSPNESGSALGSAKVEFRINGSNVLLDDVSLTPVSSTNTTPFRDEVVDTLKALNPGVLRYNDGSNTGSTIENIIAPTFARVRAGATGSVEFEDVALGLYEFLQLCQAVGAEPYYNMPASTSPQEAKNLIEYLAGASSTPYGAKRAARGQTAPWTSVFPVIHLELGNEEWNWGTFAGSAINDPVVYGNRTAEVFAAAKSSSSYNASSFDLVMGGWADVPWWNQQEIANSSNFDSVSMAPYLFYTLNDTSSKEAIFGPMFAAPEMVDSVTTGYMNQNAAIAKAQNSKLVVYEVNLSTLSGSTDQSTLTSTAASLASGLTVADHMLLMLRDLGITTQCLWALPGYSNAFTNANGSRLVTPLFGSVVDMGGSTNLRRPTYLAEQLANTAILPTMLTTTLSGANPTWVQAQSTNDHIQLSGAHELQSFAFSDGGSNRSVIVFNLSRTTARPITFSGANVPTGTVNIGQLTSANINDTNETASTVNITNSTATSFSGSSPYSLPPYSMTVFTWKQ